MRRVKKDHAVIMEAAKVMSAWSSQVQRSDVSVGALVVAASAQLTAAANYARQEMASEFDTETIQEALEELMQAGIMLGEMVVEECINEANKEAN